jgi:hypothetical protein
VSYSLYQKVDVSFVNKVKDVYMFWDCIVSCHFDRSIHTVLVTGTLQLGGGARPLLLRQIGFHGKTKKTTKVVDNAAQISTFLKGSDEELNKKIRHSYHVPAGRQAVPQNGMKANDTNFAFLNRRHYRLEIYRDKYHPRNAS